MRSWFYAADGKQQGPFPEADFRQLIARGVVRADTLVWSEGMAGWQKAGDVPGLLSGAPAPPPFPGSSGDMMGPRPGGATFSVHFGIWDFTWRSVVLVLGTAVVIPGPWVLVWYMWWFISHVYVPGRGNLAFTGSGNTIALWFFGSVLLAIAIPQTGIDGLNNIMAVVQVVLSWLFLRWTVANLASNGQPLGLRFAGSFWAYLGYNILLGLSVLTIIGWAWVYVALIRWFCRNVQDTRRAIMFKGSGLDFLWRALVVVLASLLIIPIPWAYRWMYGWLASQTVAENRVATAL
jgi:uncharacterized protein DUF4339